MRIGLLAREAGVTEAAIRFYERCGVLPEPRRTAAGYRDYDQQTVEWISFIRAGQAVGFTLTEMREVIAVRQRDEAPCTYVIELLDRHLTQISGQITRLHRVQRDLESLADRARALDPAQCSPEGICHVVVDPTSLRLHGEESGC